MPDLGNKTEDSTFNFAFNTENDLGALITFAGTPSLLFYKDDETGTETATGLTLSVDHDGVTGVHNVNAVLTDALLVTGADYRIQVKQGTVDGVDKTGSVLATFSIEHRFDDVNVAAMAANTLTASALAADASAEIARLINPQVNTAFSNITFEMFDSTDHNPATGLTVTGERSLDGGAYSAVTGTVAEIGDGTYQLDASAADMNGALIVFKFSSSGNDDSYVHIKTAA